MGWGQAPGVEEVLSCVKNIRQVAMLLQQPGRRFKGPQGPNLAAICIQAHWRYALHSLVLGLLGCDQPGSNLYTGSLEVCLSFTCPRATRLPLVNPVPFASQAQHHGLSVGNGYGPYLQST